MAAYGSNDDLTAWLAAMGLTLPEGATAEGVRTLGTILLDGTYGDRYSGSVVNAEQELEWPRVGAYRGNRILPDDVTPQAIVSAAYFMGHYAFLNPGAFFVGGSASELIKRETIGPITTEYAVASNMSADQIAAAMRVALPFVEALVSAYLEDPDAREVWIMSIGC